jgi:hypothetical protein
MSLPRQPKRVPAFRGLAHAAQVDSGPLGCARSDLLGKFTLGLGQSVLTLVVFALWKRPGVIFFPFPEGTARMDQQHLEVAATSVAIRQEACAQT